MASSNINKIVQTNFTLKPWVLSKNTSEIVNTCIQKIYKQMPSNFRRGLKTPKLASPRPENLGPLRTYINEERLKPVARLSITSQQRPIKKPLKSNKFSQNAPNLVKNVKASSGDNAQIGNKVAGVTLTSSKKLLKSPNYKIYKTRRFGSSANSSRSSIYRRNDERRRQRMHYQPQVNYLVHSFNNSQLEGTYARYLMPMRNQQLGTHLGSVEHAKRISEDIQNDLMKIDTLTRGRISLVSNATHTNDVEAQDRLNVWNHPPSLDLYRKTEAPYYTAKNNMSMGLERRKLPRLSPETRHTIKVSSSPQSQLKHAAPPTEQFPSKVDCNRIELQENHRRNRMRKLGLINDSPLPTATEAKPKADETNATAELPKTLDRNNVSCEFKTKWTPNFTSHIEAKAMVENTTPIRSYSSKFQSRLAVSNTPQAAQHSEDKLPAPPLQNSKFSTKPQMAVRLDKNEPTTKSSALLYDEANVPTSNTGSYYTSTGPAATARAQLANTINYNNYRYNRDDFFSPRKY